MPSDLLFLVHLVSQRLGGRTPEDRIFISQRDVLEDKLASRPKFCSRPPTRPQITVLSLLLGLENFVIGMYSNFLFWPRKNECNDGTGNDCEFAMVIYQSHLLTCLVLL